MKHAKIAYRTTPPLTSQGVWLRCLRCCPSTLSSWHQRWRPEPPNSLQDVKSRLDTATSASWKVTYRAKRTFLYPDEEESQNTLTEGAVHKVTVNAYERNPEARSKCLEHYGFNCSVCGFNFERAFGEIGQGFIHVHHLKPLSTMKKRYRVDPIKDLRPVCPNCHAMLHKKTPPFSIDDLSAIISQ